MGYLIVGMICYACGTFVGIAGVTLCKAAKIGDNLYGIGEE